MYRIGDAVGDYRVIGIVGTGGAGEVYKVEHSITRRVEALKVLLRDRPDFNEQSQRFLREIQVQASLSHPNIASVLTAFRAGSELMMVMELVNGRTLDEILDEGRLSRAQALAFARQALTALAFAHSHGIIHRDIKPSNMIVSQDGVLKLTDFGLARTIADTRVTNTGAVVGSLHYISPEQVRSERESDHRTDIYSMGAVLYELVTGSKPFPSDNSFSLMLAHVQSKPRPPIELDRTISPRLNAAILKAMAKNPAERFQTAQEFLAEIADVPSDGPVQRFRFGIAVWLGSAALLTVGLIGIGLRTHEWIGRRLAEVPVVPLPMPRPPAVPAADERTGPPREVIAIEVSAQPAKKPSVAYTAPAISAPPPAPAPSAAAPLTPAPAPVVERAVPPVRGGIRLLGAMTSARSATTLAISPNGRWAAAGTPAGSIEYWDLRGGRHTTVNGHAGQVNAIGFSRAGDAMATAGADGSVKIWDLEEARDRTTFGHSAPVLSVAFAADGKLAAGTADKKIRLWDVRSKSVVRELPDVRREARGLLVSPSGDMVAALSIDKVLRLWSVHSAAPPRRLDGPERGSIIGAFSSDGRYVAVTGNDEIQILDAMTGAALARHRIGPQALAISFAPDGSCVALFRTLDGIAVIDAWDGKVLRSTGRDRAIAKAVFRPDARELFMIGEGGGVAVWQELPAGARRKP